MKHLTHKAIRRAGKRLLTTLRRLNPAYVYAQVDADIETMMRWEREARQQNTYNQGLWATKEEEEIAEAMRAKYGDDGNWCEMHQPHWARQ